MKKIFFYFLILLALPTGLLAQPVTVGASSIEYGTLLDAFEAINAGDLQGNVVLQIIDNTFEYGTAVLYESGHNGTSNYTSVTIYPTLSGLTITGDVGVIDGPLIDLSGADNVTFNGSLNGSGSTADLTITNSNTGSSASTIRFTNSAENNTIRYCNIKGSETNTSGGIIFFSGSATGNGNDGNLIDLNNITADAAGRPLNVIYSSGTSSHDNSGNTISNNNIFDFLNNGTASNGINISSNSTGWSITGNSFFETTTFAPTASVVYSIIRIDNNSGDGFIITNNFIGGSAALCGSSAWTKTRGLSPFYNNQFYGIYLNVGTGTATSVQSNTIKNFSWTNSSSAPWTAIHVEGGSVNVGTSSGNTIGTATGTASVTVTGGATNTNVYGIFFNGTGTIDCRNNIIGAITAANLTAGFATNFYGIHKSNTGGSIIINSNTIGSTATANSINATSASTLANNQIVIGINNTGTGNITISGNTIANMNNGTTNTSGTRRGLINGIASSDGINTISSNIIHDLTIANGNISAAQNASVCGISLIGIISAKTITGNTVYNLVNSYSSFGGSVIGIYFLGNTGANTVKENFIHSLAITGGSTLTDATVYGIKIAGGATTYSNNIISLGGSTASNLCGIFETGGNNNNLYFNSISISGTGSGTFKSYALSSAVNTNVRDFRNNLFINTRSTTSGTNLHYAAFITSPGGSITCDYNDYLASGTGGTLGYYGGNITTLPIVSGQDVNSFAINPVYANAGGTAPTDYMIGMDLVGLDGTGITSDFLAVSRVLPTIGAFERPLNRWKGATSTDWATASNWTESAVPMGSNLNLVFDSSPGNNLIMSADQQVININNSTTYQLVTNTHKLTIKGTLNFTGGAQINASSTGSTVEYAGTTAQTIAAGTFYQDNIYNLIVNNTGNLTLNGTIYILNTLTTTAGLFDATTNSPTMGYGGSTPQTIDAADFLNGEVYNLTLANTSTASIVSDFIVNNNVLINASGNLTITPPYTLIVTGSISNSGGNSGLIIRSGGNGNDGKLINNTASVNATVELSLSGGAGAYGPSFHYFVPPVGSMTIGALPADARANLGLTNFNGDLLAFSEPLAVLNKNAGWQYFDGWGSTTPFSTIQSTRGYNFYLTAPDKATFTGQLNSGAHSFNIDYTSANPSPGWNLIGNPYPCNYDLEGISALTGTGDGVDNTVYFNYNGGYRYWNVELGAGSTGFSSIVAPMQGFFVLATSAGTVNLPVGSKTGGSALPVRSKSLSLVKKIKLVLNNGTAPDETIICLLDNATNGFDGDYDAYKLFGSGTTTPSIYSEINALKYAINCVKGPHEGKVTIPITVVIKTSGTYSIDFTEFENLSDTKVILKHGDVETIVSENTSYSFSSLPGTFTNFELIMGESGTPEEEIPTDVEPITNEPVKTWYSNNYLYIYCPGNISYDRGKLTIFDIQGKIVYSDSELFLSPGEAVQIGLDLPSGVYVTHVIINNQRFVTKIVVF